MRLIYKIIPIPVIETNRFIPKRFGAMSLGVCVLIRPNKYHEALIAHELTHCRQFYRTAGLHAPLYWLSKSYRLHAEVEAYRKQGAMLDNPPWNSYAKWIAENYGLNVTEQEVLNMLTK